MTLILLAKNLLQTVAYVGGGIVPCPSAFGENQRNIQSEDLFFIKITVFGTNNRQNPDRFKVKTFFHHFKKFSTKHI